METQISGALLIASFVALALAWTTGVPGLYAAQDIDERMRLLERHRRRWLVTQAEVALYGPLATLGFLFLSLDLASSGGGWLAAAGTLAMAVGTASGVYFIYLQTSDPRGGYSGRYPLPEVAAYWFWLAGLLLVGIALLVGGAPVWLGVISAGGAAAFAVYYLVTGQGFLTPGLTGVVGLLIGLVMFFR